MRLALFALPVSDELQVPATAASARQQSFRSAGCDAL